MKKARIILAAVALLAIAGGALAFSAGKFTAFKALTYTHLYTTNGTVYTAPASYCIWTGRFATNVGGVETLAYVTTSTLTAPGSIIFTAPGNITLAVSTYTCPPLVETQTIAAP